MYLIHEGHLFRDFCCSRELSRAELINLMEEIQAKAKAPRSQESEVTFDHRLEEANDLVSLQRLYQDLNRQQQEVVAKMATPLPKRQKIEE